MQFFDPIHYAIPFFVILLVSEAVISAYQKKDYFQAKDTAASLTMGIGNVITNLLGKAMIFGVFSWVYQFCLFEIPVAAWWSWLILFLAEDLSYYLFHRTSHQCRYFWASHVIHHSSEKYNLGTALRQTWTGTLSGSFVFWLWLPLLGFHPAMVMTMMAINLLYQFWIHTEIVNKLPAPIEWLFNTPSHHRVHHGSDLKYLDLNHAGTLMIWDRLFGTFKAEEDRPTYGLTKNLNSFNPLKIAFHEWGQMIRDVRRAPGLKNKLGYMFGPPGWSHDGSRMTTRQRRNAVKNL